MIPVILSGGSGTRLWPVSRVQWPKQFCELFEESLMALTIRRLKPLGSPRVLTSETLRFLTQRALKLEGLASGESLFEPSARNTAPAIAFLIKRLIDEGLKESVVGIFPADQLISNESEFLRAVSEAKRLAEVGQVVTLGIHPTEPNSGYGYIELHKNELAKGSPVVKFHEKPSLETAAAFLKTGRFVWNAGIFIFKVATMERAFKEHQPEMWTELEKLKVDLSNLSEVYGNLKSISIDYAIAEKLSSTELSCVPCDIGWSDVGSWDAVADISSSMLGLKPKLVEAEAQGNFVYSKQGKTYSVVGADDLIIVDTADALLIAKKGFSQEVKKVVEALTKAKDSVVVQHNFEKRPWGEFEVLRDTERFKSKVIQVEPGQQLSLQSHAKREEHWVVTTGTGEVVLNDKVMPVKAGTYVHIPLGARHRMRNNGSSRLEFIEVQLGSYFGEDDIVRYQDDYRRG